MNVSDMTKPGAQAALTLKQELSGLREQGLNQVQSIEELCLRMNRLGKRKKDLACNSCPSTQPQRKIPRVQSVCVTFVCLHVNQIRTSQTLLRAVFTAEQAVLRN